MSKVLHAAGKASEQPTPAQLREFFAQVETGRVTKEKFQRFLRGTERPGTPQQPLIVHFRKELGPTDTAKPSWICTWDSYWDKEFPGAGPDITHGLFEFLHPNFSFQLHTKEYIDKNDLPKNIKFLGKCGIHGVQYLDIAQLSARLNEKQDLEVWRYTQQLESYLFDALDNLDHLFSVDGHTLFSNLRAKCAEFIEEPIEVGRKVFSGLIERFWYELTRDVGNELAHYIKQREEAIDDNLDMCVFACVVGPFLSQTDFEDIKTLSILWARGNYPIGVTRDNQLIVLCA